MSEQAKQVLKGHRRQIVGIGCEELLPVDFNAFNISMIWPTVLYLFRYGRRRGKGNWEATYAIEGCRSAPTPRQVSTRFRDRASEVLQGFDSDAGRDILADWLASGILDTIWSSGDPDDPVIRIRPLHALTSWVDLPKSVANLRGIPEFLVSTLANGGKDDKSGNQGPFAVRQPPESNLLYRVFGRGLRIPDLDDRTKDAYEETVGLDPDILLCIRLAQTMGHAPPEQKGDSARLPAFGSVNQNQLRRLREDFSALLRAYGHSAPPAVLADFLGSATALNLTPFFLGHMRAVLGLFETGALQRPSACDSALFLDCTDGNSEKVKEAAERSFLNHVELMHRYLRAHLGFRWLARFVEKHGKTLKIQKQEIPDPNRDTIKYLTFLAELRGAPKMQTLAETRLDQFQEAYEQAGEEMDETVRGLIELEIEPEAEPFDRWLSVLLAIQKDLGERLVTQFYPGLTGANTSFGLLRLGSRREPHRYSLSDTLLETLVHALTLRRKSPLQGCRPSIRQFLQDLRNHYGLYIHELPPQLDPYGGPASLREANLNALKDRLRRLGLFQAVSDAEAMQRIQGRYPVRLHEDTEVEP